jgi:hypothetical protein
MPVPGTLDHFEWLAALEVPEGSYLYEAESFLDYTQAAISFSRFIRANRTPWPARRKYMADLNTTLLDLEPGSHGIFRASVETNPNLPEHGALIIHGQPHPNEEPDKNYIYDVFIPIKARHYYDPSHDRSRAVQAAYHWQSYENIRDKHSLVYNELSQRKNDPLILISALKEAAYDLHSIFQYTHGNNGSSPKLGPAPPELARWHPDYLTDDPNQFMPKP